MAAQIAWCRDSRKGLEQVYLIGSATLLLVLHPVAEGHDGMQGGAILAIFQEVGEG